jgi:hypothetical protein
MIRLNLKKEPYWLDLLPGLSVQVAPLTSAVLSAASTSAPLRALPPEADMDMRFLVLTAEVAKLVILGWRGVEGPDGEEVEPTPETVGALIDVPQVAKAFKELFVTPGLLVSAEKNG